jgi:hypothetical protein
MFPQVLGNAINPIHETTSVYCSSLIYYAIVQTMHPAARQALQRKQGAASRCLQRVRCSVHRKTIVRIALSASLSRNPSKSPFDGISIDPVAVSPKISAVSKLRYSISEVPSVRSESVMCSTEVVSN